MPFLLILFLFSSACKLDQEYPPGMQLLIPTDCNFFMHNDKQVIYYIKQKDFLGVTFTLGVVNTNLVANGYHKVECPDVFNISPFCKLLPPSRLILVRVRDNDQFVIQLEGQKLWVTDGFIYDVYTSDEKKAKVFYLYK